LKLITCLKTWLIASHREYLLRQPYFSNQLKTYNIKKMGLKFTSKIAFSLFNFLILLWFISEIIYPTISQKIILLLVKSMLAVSNEDMK